jgi:hypothetical protein
MDDATRAAIGSEVSAAFRGHAVVDKALQDGRVAYKVEGVPLPPGCKPERSDVLLVYNSRTEPPTMYVRDSIVLRNGAVPRNLTPTQIDGELWYQFSANYSYDNSKPVSVYVYGRLGRFLRDE